MLAAVRLLFMEINIRTPVVNDNLKQIFIYLRLRGCQVESSRVLLLT